MDQQAANLLAALRRPAASSESKLALLNSLKSDIKHFRVPENAQPSIFEALKQAIAQQSSSSIASAAFSTLGHLIKRLKIQDPEGKAIAALAPRLFPALQERLGDQRDAYRQGAAQALSEIWPFCSQDVEHLILEDAIGGTNARAKQEGMHWVARMHQEHGLHFKSFVGQMVARLEDPDGSVRDAAKESLIELFTPASTPAKNDLKKQLRLHEVRSTIVEQILKQIGIGASAAPAHAHQEVDLAASTRSLPALDHMAHFAEAFNSEEARPPPVEEVQMDPLFVDSQRELEDMFRDMLPHFEGKESEENWPLRDKDITKLRKITKGNAPSEFHHAYMAGMKQLQEGTLKQANSLRTTPATNACQLVQELARTLGPAMDSLTELYLQNFIKMCANTKNIAAQNGNLTTETIFQYVSYNVRLVQHISMATQDKNKNPRMFAAGWLRTLLNRQTGSKHHFETSGGLEIAEKTIRKCLEDADPKVKESFRATYWAYAKIWPEKAASMLNSLDPKIRSAVERDSHNPNAPKGGAQSAFSASTTSRPGGARSSLREKIAADKRAAAANKQPARPMTAMASMSPAKSRSMANLGSGSRAMAPPAASGSARVASNMSVASTSSVKSNDTATSTSSTATTRPNSLMSGAARRPVKRPEVPRPQTADPYATRKGGRPETPSTASPVNSPRQSTLGRPTAASIAKNRVGRTASPAASPLRQTPGTKSLIDSRLGSKEMIDTNSEEPTQIQSDDFTIVLPKSNATASLANEEQRIPQLDKTMSVDSGISAMTEEDNFTMVMPNMRASTSAAERTRERSPLAFRSPGKSLEDGGSYIPRAGSPKASIQAGASPSGKPSSPSNVRSPSTRSVPTQRKEPSPEVQQHANGIQRAGSPLKMSTVAQPQQEEVQIYEDPFVAESRQQEAEAAEVRKSPNVLAELPINDNQRPASPPPATDVAAASPNGQLDGETATDSTERSPQTNAEIMRSRKLLQSGIERIKARTLDTHGFRKVYELTRQNSPADLFGSEASSKRFDELVSALCEFITLPSDMVASASSTKQAQPAQAHELKRQALTLLKSMLASQEHLYRKLIASSSWASKILSSALLARKGIEGLGMVVKDIETVCSECLRLCPRETTVDTITRFLEQTQQSSTAPAQTNGDAVPEKSPAERTTAHALSLGLKLLTRTVSSNTEGTEQADALSSEQGAQLAGTASTFLKSKDAEVRKCAVDLTTTLYSVWPISKQANEQEEQNVEQKKRTFWSAMEKNSTLNQGTRDLLLYFIARREGKVEAT